MLSSTVVLIAFGSGIGIWFWSCSSDPLAPLIALCVFVSTALFACGSFDILTPGPATEFGEDAEAMQSRERRYQEWAHDIRSRHPSRLSVLSDTDLRWEYEMANRYDD